jgi:photosystem II stability/assembly factor-like uncharacterized protein
MKWISITLTLFGLTQFAIASDVFVLVEYDGRGQAYDLLDDGWAVVEAHPSFCLILCSEERSGAVPGGRVIADGSETLYVIWNPGNRPLPDIRGTRIIDVPGKAQILVARAADAMEYAAAGAELKLVNKTPIRKPLDGPPLRPIEDNELVHEMIGEITPERYQEIVETLSLGVTPTRYTPCTYIDAARDYVQTTFHEIPNSDVLVWQYEGKYAHLTEMYWSGKNDGWISTDGYIWRTDDAGESWTAYECDGDALDVVFTDAKTGFTCGRYGFLAKTEDGGLTWTGVDIHEFGLDLKSLSFANPSNGITGGSDGFYCATDDGGDTWVKGRIPGANDIRDVFYRDNVIWAGGGWYSYCQLYRSTDSGETWEDFTSNLPFLPDNILSRIWFHDPSNGVIIGEGSVYYTEDGGNTWTEAAGEYSGGLHDIFFIDDKTGWIAGHYAVYRTDDGGKSWAECDNSPNSNDAISFVNANEGWAVSYHMTSNMYHTDDGGYTWEEVFPTFVYPSWENVIAEIEGAVSPDEVLILCGHYDSISEDPYRLAPGADDNASGTGGVMTAAGAMAEYEYESTVRFIAFSGEEEGLFGSVAYAEAMAEKGENIVAVINMDMVAYLDEPVYDIMLDYNGPSVELMEAIVDAAATYTPEMVIYPYIGLDASDHASFWDNGYRAVMLIEQANDHWYPWYHSSEDLPEHLDFTYGAEVVRLAAAAAACLAGITGRRPDDGEAGVIAYPNPARPGDAGITFTNLPDDASLALYNVAGERVFERSGITGNEMVWTLVNDGGNPVASGVYIYRVIDGEGNYATGKVAVIK